MKRPIWNTLLTLYLLLGGLSLSANVSVAEAGYLAADVEQEVRDVPAQNYYPCSHYFETNNDAQYLISAVAPTILGSSTALNSNHVLFSGHTLPASLARLYDDEYDDASFCVLTECFLAPGRRMGSRGARNTDFLTAGQERQLMKHVDELGLNPKDIQFSKIESYYSESFDYLALGPNAFPAPAGASSRIGGTVLERMTPRSVVAHEAGHMITSRVGKDFPAGTLLDEVQSSLVGRQLPGLNRVERWQLLRDAAERARNEGQSLRNLLPQLNY